MNKITYKIVQINKPSLNALERFNREVFQIIQNASPYYGLQSAKKICLTEKHAI